MCPASLVDSKRRDPESEGIEPLAMPRLMLEREDISVEKFSERVKLILQICRNILVDRGCYCKVIA